MTCSCGLVSDLEDAPTHAYVVSSPGCWAIFSGLLQANVHRLFTDAYMVQHADGDDPRQLQSVTVHLLTLHAIKGHGHDVATASRITRAGIEVGRRLGGYPKLAPPSRWQYTVADVAGGDTGADEYVDSVYDTWLNWDEETLEKRTRAALEHLYG